VNKNLRAKLDAEGFGYLFGSGLSGDRRSDVRL
jgi:hypothetical protein